MVEDILNKKIAAAIRTEKDFSKALKSRVDVVFLLHSNIITVNQSVKEIHGAGKKAFVHLDFAEGIGKDRAWSRWYFDYENKYRKDCQGVQFDDCAEILHCRFALAKHINGVYQNFKA